MPRVLWGLSSSRDSSETCPGPRPVPICENVSRNPSIHLDVNGFVQSCMNHEKLETFMYFFLRQFYFVARTKSTDSDKRRAACPAMVVL